MKALVFPLERPDLDAGRLSEVADVREQHLQLLLVRKLPQGGVELDLEFGDLRFESRDVGCDRTHLTESSL